MFLRESLSLSIAIAQTTAARVESKPPEIPIKTFCISAGNFSILPASASDWISRISRQAFNRASSAALTSASAFFRASSSAALTSASAFFRASASAALATASAFILASFSDFASTSTFLRASAAAAIATASAFFLSCPSSCPFYLS